MVIAFYHNNRKVTKIKNKMPVKQKYVHMRESDSLWLFIYKHNFRVKRLLIAPSHSVAHVDKRRYSETELFG